MGAGVSVVLWPAAVSLGRVACVILGQVLWRVRLPGLSSPYFWNLCRERDSRKGSFCFR